MKSNTLGSNVETKSHKWKKNHKKHEASNVIGAPPSSWSSWCRSRFSFTSSSNGELGWSSQHHSKNTTTSNLIFSNGNENVAINQVFNQAFDVVLPRTKACDLPSTKGKLNKKITNRKRRLFKGPSIVKTIKKIHKLQKKWSFWKCKWQGKSQFKYLKMNKQGGNCSWRDSYKWLFFLPKY